MSRHITDHRSTPETGRLKNFVGVERKHGREGSHPSVKAVHERPASRNAATRIRAFLKIERGQTS